MNTDKNITETIIEKLSSIFPGEKFGQPHCFTSSGKRKENPRIYITIKKEYSNLETLKSIQNFRIPKPLALLDSGVVTTHISGTSLEKKLISEGLIKCTDLLEETIENIASFHKNNRGSLGVGYAHGDLDPFNILVDEQERPVGLIDWEDFSTEGIQDLDAIHFITMLGVILNPQMKHDDLYFHMFNENKNVYNELLGIYCKITGQPIKNMESFNVIIVGAGPSGIFAALKLIENNPLIKIAVIERGGNYYSRKNEETKSLIGFGGAAMRYDANLDYANGIPISSNLGERVFGSKESALTIISEVYKKLSLFGLNNETNSKDKAETETNPINFVDRGILPIGEKKSSEILKKIYEYLINNGVIFFEYTEVTNVGKSTTFEIQAVNLKQDTPLFFKSDFVIWSTGKLSVESTINIFNNLGIDYLNCNTLDVGIRIETNKDSTEEITRECVNPKIILSDKSGDTRTFCWCPQGKVIYYDFLGYKILDGQHCHDTPTNQTNFGIVTKITLPKDINGITLAIDMLRKTNLLTDNKVGLQLLKDFIAGKTSSQDSLKGNSIEPSIEHFSLVDISQIVPEQAKNKIIKLIYEINRFYPESIPENALIYAPVIERAFAQPNINFDMESSVKGFYVIGDISGKAIGIITGAAMGIKAAKHIQLK